MNNHHSFYFIRHGETDWNKKQLCQGQTDIPLNDLGIQSAFKAAQALKNFPIELVVTSPLKRAKQTAQIIGEALNLEVQVYDEFAERCYGKLEGGSNKLMYQVEDQEALPIHNIDYVGLRIETKEALLTRIAAGMTKLLRQDKMILLVSHGMLFNSICEYLETDKIKQLPNACPVYLESKNNAWKSEVLRIKKISAEND